MARAEVPATLPAPAGCQVFPNLVYGQSDQRPLLLDLYVPNHPAGPYALIVRFAPERPVLDSAALGLLKNGFALAHVGYLPAGYVGTYRRFPLDLWACKAAVRFLRAGSTMYQIDPQRIAAWGQGGGATMGLLMAATNNIPSLEGAIGQASSSASTVAAACESGGITDLSRAELYGDELVNEPAGVAYALLGGNVKEHPIEALIASPAYYITPATPPCLALPDSSNLNNTMRESWIDQLQRAGVDVQTAPTAPEPAAYDAPILAFFNKTLAHIPAEPQPDPLLAQKLIVSKLFIQAHRLVDPHVRQNPADATWAPLAAALANAQAVAAADELKFAIAHEQFERGQAALAALRKSGAARELVVGWQNATNAMQVRFDHRFAVLSQQNTLNRLVQTGDWNAADRTLRAMAEMANLRGGDPEGLVQDAGNRLNRARAQSLLQTMAGVRVFPWATAYGTDLYGMWIDLRVGDATQRLRYIPPGKFFMGSPADEWGRQPDEPLPHEETIVRGLWMAETPCTQDLYEAVMGKNANHSYFKGSRLPIEEVSYAHAANFCKALGLSARLPTEAEWEYACRAGTPSAYALTGRLADTAWYWDNSRSPSWPAKVPGPDGHTTHQVALKLPNGLGLYDMQGNVWQWCLGERRVSGKEYHVARGGSWISIAPSCRAARHQWQDVEHATWNVGFRFLIPAEEPQVGTSR